MKAIGGLFDSIATFENVAAAAWRAGQGKRERRAVAAFFGNFEANVNDLVRDLVSGEFRFEGYSAFAIRDPKTRLIHAPSFRDRVVHHAMIAVLGPVFEKGAIAHSYACRAGKGQHAALTRVRHWVRRGDAFLKVDVAKYYDSIPHDRLRRALARRFRERRVLALFDRLLDSHYHRPGHGLPIGALTSQYLGNFFLEPIDHWVHQVLRIPRYARYMDDLLLIDDPDHLRDARVRLIGRLEAHGLEAKRGGVLNHASQGIPWLGFTVYPDRIRLDARGRRRLRRRLRLVEQADLSSQDLQARATALFAHASFADDLAWRRAVCRFSRFSDADFGDTQEPEPRHARRLVGQHRQEVPFRLPEQEAPAQPQQEPGLPGPALAPRHGGVDAPPDDACSRAPATQAGDKTAGKTPPPAERRARMGPTKAAGGAPSSGEGERA